MGIIAGMLDIQSMDWEIQRPALERQVENTGFLDIGIVQLNGQAIYSDGTKANFGEMDYIQRALSGESVVSDVFVSSLTNNLILMYAAPIERDGKIVGAVIGRRDGDVLSDIIEDISYGEEGYAYIVNQEGTMVAHRDRDMVKSQYNAIEERKSDESQESLALLIETIIEEKQGVSNYAFNGEDLYAAYSPVEGTEWTLVITANEDEIMSSIPRMRNTILISIVIILAISMGIVYYIGSAIANPIIVGVEYSEKIASLDLTNDIPEEYIRRKDEIGSLAVGLQNLTNSLRKAIREIDNSSGQVAATSEELTATTQQVSIASEEVSRTAEEIARGASEQAISTEDGASKAIRLGESMERDLEYMEGLNTSSQQVSKLVEEGLKEIDNLYKITEESNKAAGEIYDVILKTNESSNKIGEAGRGFAVVADEIRQLAEQSSTSTRDIDEIVSDLQTNAQEAVNTMKRISIITNEQTKSVEENKNSYSLIGNAMEEAENAVGKLNISSEVMSKMRDEILENLQNLSAIAEENSAATQEVTASMEEQTASTEEISSASEDLAHLAENLQNIIREFKL